MASTRRESILIDVLETLTLIKGQPPYATNFVTVEDGLRDAESLGEQEFDYIGVSTDPDIRTEHKHETIKFLRNELPILIAAHVRVPDAVTEEADVRAWRRRLASDAIADIIHAMDIDPTRYGFASGTYLQNSISTEAMDNTAACGAIVTVVLLYKIVFNEETTRPEIEMAYGEIRMGINSQQFAFAGAVLAWTTTLGFTKYFDSPQNGRLRYIGPKTRRFMVTLTWTVQPDNDAGTLTMTLYKNGAIETVGMVAREVMDFQELRTLHITRIVELAYNDYLEIFGQPSNTVGLDSTCVILNATELVQ